MSVGRSILGIVLAAAIVGLIAFARGDTEHPGRDESGAAPVEMRLTL